MHGTVIPYHKIDVLVLDRFQSYNNNTSRVKQEAQNITKDEAISLHVPSHKLQVHCVVSFYFCLYLMLYACDQRFDVIRNLENF